MHKLKTWTLLNQFIAFEFAIQNVYALSNMILSLLCLRPMFRITRRCIVNVTMQC